METAFSRMDLVQSPVIPVVGQWIVDSPGTISLGQGVAFYPPPNEVAVAVRESLEQTPLHQYQPVAGIPSLISALTEKLRRDNDINLSSDQAVVVTAGANMGFFKCSASHYGGGR